MRGLTERQKQVLEQIVLANEAHGYPPTLREIGRMLGIHSTNGVSDHVKALIRKGYLQRRGHSSRTILPTSEGLALLGKGPLESGERAGTAAGRAAEAVQAAPLAQVIPFSPSARSSMPVAEPATPERLVVASTDEVEGLQPIDPSRLVSIPILGRVAAGLPILATEQVEDRVHIDRALLPDNHAIFGLRVQGDSMIGDGIFDGDFVFVRKQFSAAPGSIVVVLIDDEATVKRYFPEGDRVRFQPSNPAMEPIYVHRREFRQSMLIGVVVGVYRRI